MINSVYKLCYELREEQAALARRAKIKKPANVALAAAIARFREPYGRNPWRKLISTLPC